MIEDFLYSLRSIRSSLFPSHRSSPLPIEPQHGPAIKSRTKAHWTKCEKSLIDMNFRAANESFL